MRAAKSGRARFFSSPAFSPPGSGHFTNQPTRFQKSSITPLTSAPPVLLDGKHSGFVDRELLTAVPDRIHDFSPFSLIRGSGAEMRFFPKLCTLVLVPHRLIASAGLLEPLPVT